MNYIVQIMNDIKNNEDFLKILRKLSESSDLSQRNLASKLGFSLGKLNYCLTKLKKRGLIKIKNFKKNPNKIGYLYVLTPKGISTKTKITINFMKQKAQEYNELKSEINSDKIKKIDEDLL